MQVSPVSIPYPKKLENKVCMPQWCSDTLGILPQRARAVSSMLNTLESLRKFAL